MKDWQTRVITERDDLGHRLTLLSIFIAKRPPDFDGLPEDGKNLLRRQREVMMEYYDVLEERISGFV